VPAFWKSNPEDERIRKPERRISPTTGGGPIRHHKDTKDTKIVFDGGRICDSLSVGLLVSFVSLWCTISGVFAFSLSP
jgi:hypothetical protein